MEVFTPPPYREARLKGRQPKLTHETRLLVAAKVTSKEMTFREAAKAYGISTAAVSTCVKLAAKEGTKSKRNEKVNDYNAKAEAYRHQAQIKELKEVIGDLYLENQILKKILNKSLLIKKSNGSVITTNNLDQLQKDVE
jgi:transposase